MLAISKENLQKLRQLDLRQEATTGIQKSYSSDPNIFQQTQDLAKSSGLLEISSDSNIYQFFKNNIQATSLGQRFSNSMFKQDMMEFKKRREFGRRPDLLKDTSLDFGSGFNSNRRIYLSDKPQVIASLVRKASLTRTSSALEDSDFSTPVTRERSVHRRGKWIARKGRKIRQHLGKLFGKSSLSLENSSNYGPGFEIDGRILRAVATEKPPVFQTLTRPPYIGQEDSEFTRGIYLSSSLRGDQYISQVNLHNKDIFLKHSHTAKVEATDSFSIKEAKSLKKKDSTVEITAEVHSTVAMEGTNIECVNSSSENVLFQENVQCDDSRQPKSSESSPKSNVHCSDKLDEEVENLATISGQEQTFIQNSSEDGPTAQINLIRQNAFNKDDLELNDVTCKQNSDLNTENNEDGIMILMGEKADVNITEVLPAMSLHQLETLPNADDVSLGSRSKRSWLDQNHSILLENSNSNIIANEVLGCEYISVAKEVTFNNIETAKLISGREDEVDNLYLSLLDINSIEEKNSHSEVAVSLYYKLVSVLVCACV